LVERITMLLTQLLLLLLLSENNFSFTSTLLKLGFQHLRCVMFLEYAAAMLVLSAPRIYPFKLNFLDTHPSTSLYHPKETKETV
jgi:hypothetical protein